MHDMHQGIGKARRLDHGYAAIAVIAVILLIGIALLAIPPGGDYANPRARMERTLERMQRIEAAMNAYMTAHGRRPCPADGTVTTNDPQFGVESPTPGVCNGANFSNGSIVASAAAGAIPTKTLGLGDEYALDGYGRRLMYIVDSDATEAATCQGMQSHGAPGALRIMGTSTDTVAADTVMWALVSYGQDGHGAFPSQGSTVAGRINTQSTDADTNMNAFVDANFNDSFSGQLVRREPSPGFDDFVWFADATKNRCCAGDACLRGFRINGTADGLDVPAGITVVAGDVNGDTIQDLVIGVPSAHAVYVVFGKRTGWPVRPDSFTLPPDTAQGLSILDAGQSTPYFGRSLFTGDVNQDGVDDIAIVAEGTVYVVFGGASLGANLDIGDLDGTNGSVIVTSGVGVPGAITMGDVNGDSYRDLIVVAEDGTSAAWVIYGRPSPWPNLITLGSLASDGFMIFSSDTSTFPFGAGLRSVASGNINGDSNGLNAVDDIVLGARDAIGGMGRVFVIFGRASGWPSGDPPAPVDIVTETANPATGVRLAGGAENSLGQSVAVGNLNGDGISDIITISDKNIYGYFGKASSWTTPINLSTSANLRIDTFSGRPPGVMLGAGGSAVFVADVNSDGVPDLIATDPVSSMSAASAGNSFLLFSPSSDTGWTSTGWQPNSPITLFATAPGGGFLNLDGKRGTVIEGAAGDFAYASTVVDINKDSKNDVMFAAPGYGDADIGAVYILFGRRHVPWKSGTNLDLLN